MVAREMKQLPRDLEASEPLRADDERWMFRALSLADQAARLGEVPVGAVLVRDGRVIGQGHNQPIGHTDPSAHAEIVALRDAASRLSNYRLPDSTLYVTLEPCPMCAGALIHARVARVVAAAPDPRGGACGSVVNLFGDGMFNHRVNYRQGLLEARSAALLRAFFRARR